MIQSELISQIKNQIRIVNADTKITNRFVWSIISKNARWLIKREADKLKLMKHDFLFQTFKCVEIEEAPAIDDCCGVRSRCTVMRTKLKMPKMFEGGDGVIIKSVYSIDGSQEYTPIKVQDYMRKLENPHSQYDNSKYFYYNNGYTYFPSIKKPLVRLKKVMVKAYFEDDIQALNCCDGEKPMPIRKMQQSFRFPDYLLGELMATVMKDLSFTIQVKPDEQIDKNQIRIA